MADEDYVKRGLAPYADRLRRVADDGYADWVQSSDKSKFIFQRSKACSRFDHIARHARIEFANDKDVKIVEEYESIKLGFCKETIWARFKHEGRNGLGVNGQETQTVLEFINAEPTLPGIPVQHNVDCCFRENELDTALESVKIVGRHMHTLLWSYELPKPSADVVPLPSPTPTPDQSPPVVRRRRKDADEQEPGKG